MSEATPATNSSVRRPARRGPAPRVLAAGALALVTAVCAALAARVVAAPEGALAGLSPFAYAHDARAAQHMKAVLSSEDLDEAEHEARLALGQSPANAVTWVRLAYIDTWRRRAVTPEAIQYLSRSYEVSPLGPDVSYARIKYVLEAWAGLPQALRDQAMVDLESLWRRRPEEAERLVKGVMDPYGRLVAGMALAEFEAKRALAPKS